MIVLSGPPFRLPGDETYPVKIGSVPMSFDSLMGYFSSVPGRPCPRPSVPGRPVPGRPASVPGRLPAVCPGRLCPRPSPGRLSPAVYVPGRLCPRPSMSPAVYVPGRLSPATLSPAVPRIRAVPIFTWRYHSLVRDTPSRHPGRIVLGASWSMRIRQWRILLICSDSLHLMVRQRTGVMRVIMPAVRSTGQPRRGVCRRRR